MRQIRVRVSVPIKSALHRGSSQYGPTVVALSDDDVQSLSESARAILVDAMEMQDGTIDCGLVVDIDTNVAVVDALESMARGVQECQKSLAQESEQRIQTALAAPEESWVYESGAYAPTLEPWPSGCYLSSQEQEDPRILARMAEIQPYHDSLLMAWEAKEAQRQYQEQQEQRSKAVRIEQCIVALRELAQQEDDMARSVSEGYAVETVMLNRLLDRFVRQLSVRLYHSTSVDVVEQLADCQECQAPAAEDFQAFDEATMTARRQNTTIPMAVGSWVVSRINTYTIGSGIKINGVSITLDTPIGIRQALISRYDIAQMFGS